MPSLRLNVMALLFLITTSHLPPPLSFHLISGLQGFLFEEKVLEKSDRYRKNAANPVLC